MLMINMTDKEVNIFKDNDIPFADFLVENGSRFGSDIIIGLKELQAGSGDTSFNVNESGIWLGAKKFVDAPFSVDMNGQVVASSLIISGFVPTGGAAADINDNTTEINGGKIVTGSINASKITTGTLTADMISSGTLTVDSGLVGITVKSGGDIEFESETYSSFSSILFKKKDVADPYWDIYFTATGGNGYNEGDLVFESGNNGQHVTIGSYALTTISRYTHLSVYGDISGNDIYGGDIYSQKHYFGDSNYLAYNDANSISSNCNLVPSSSFIANLGSSDYRWGNVYTSNVDFAGGNAYLNYSGGFIQSNSQFRVVGSINLTGNLTFENNASITIGGRAYYQTTGAYDASKYYLRSS